MKKAAFLLTSGLLLLVSCQSLHRGIPMSDRHRTQKVVAIHEDETITVTETEPAEEPIVSEEESSVASAIVEGTPEADPVLTHPFQQKERQLTVLQDDTIRKIVDPGPEKSEEEILDEALESERVAQKALSFSYVPIVSILFFPALFIGIIGTLTCLSRFRRFEYVTQKGLEYEEKARRTLILSCVLPFVFLALFILMLILLL